MKRQSSPSSLQRMVETWRQVGGDQQDAIMTSERLYSLLFSFADVYQERVAQTVDQILAREPDARSRYFFQGTKVVYVSSALNIAVGNNPLVDLLDMAVMVGLQALVWEDGCLPWVPKASAQRLAKTLKGLDREITATVASVFGPAAAEELRAAILHWREENPDQVYVAFIRFKDFASTRHKEVLEQAVKNGGLLGPVEDAVREMQATRLTVERALFMASHMPLLMEWHAELFLYRSLETPEIVQLLKDYDQLTDTGENMARDFRLLPDRLAQERASLLKGVARVIAEQRKETMQQARRMLTAYHKTLISDLEQSAATLGPLLDNSRQAGLAMRDTLQSLERILGALRSQDAGAINLAELNSTLKNIAASAGGLRLLLQSFDQALAGERRGQVAAMLDEALARHLARIFWYTAGLLLLFFFLLAITLVVVRRFGKIS